MGVFPGGATLLGGAAVLLLNCPSALADSACFHPRGGTTLRLAPLLRPAGSPPAPDPSRDYRHLLQTTVLGWPLQSTWCVWVEPPEAGSETSPTTKRWLSAVAGALGEWALHLPVQIVPTPERAQVTLWRRRPPLALDGSGRPRASHGRAILSLLQRDGGTDPPVEPGVVVLISPGQRLEAIQATALHELGHAFGLWGHSDDPRDAMAVAQGSRPVLRLSERDRATLRWLYAQPTPMRSDP